MQEYSFRMRFGSAPDDTPMTGKTFDWLMVIGREVDRHAESAQRGGGLEMPQLIGGGSG